MQATPPHKFPTISPLLPATKLAPFTSSISYPRHHRLSSSAVSPILLPPSTEPITPPLPKYSVATSFWDYQMLFLSQRSETSRPIDLRISEGAIPSDFPLGTYYLIGPGIFSDDHGSTVHPLDGHGYLRAFEFGDGGAVRYSARYVDGGKEGGEGGGDGGMAVHA